MSTFGMGFVGGLLVTTQLASCRLDVLPDEDPPGPAGPRINVKVTDEGGAPATLAMGICAGETEREDTRFLEVRNTGTVPVRLKAVLDASIEGIMIGLPPFDGELAPRGRAQGWLTARCANYAAEVSGTLRLVDASSGSELWSAPVDIACWVAKVDGLPTGDIDLGEARVSGPPAVKRFTARLRIGGALGRSGKGCSAAFALGVLKPWLAITPPDGALTPEFFEIPIEAVATCTTPGPQEAKVFVQQSTSVGKAETLEVKARLFCKEAGPDITDLDPRAPDLGAFCGKREATFGFSNQGTEALDYSVEEPIGLALAKVKPAAAGALAPGQPAEATVRIRCRGNGSHRGSVTVLANNEPNPAQRIQVYEPRWRCNCKKKGALWGDPHIIPFDGGRFDFQAAGEFVVLEGPPGLKIQARMQPFAGQLGVSVVTAIATRIGDRRVALYAGRDPSLVIDGTPIAAHQALPTLAGGARIERVGAHIHLTWPSGEELGIDVGTRMLHADVALPDERHGAVRGLLGDFDGDPANDRKTRDGRLLGSAPDLQDVYGAYADSWRIGAEESLFDYAAGESPATFTRRDFPKRRATASALAPSDYQRAEAVCRATGVAEPRDVLEACILDVHVTGDETLAVAALNAATPSAPPGADTPDADVAAEVGAFVGSWKQKLGAAKDYALVTRRGEAPGSIEGVYAHDQGALVAVVDADGVAHGWWNEAPSRKPSKDAGELEFRVVGGELVGRWRYGQSGAWRAWRFAPNARPLPAGLIERFGERATFLPHP